ncbi:hypothetical protein LCGC14_2274150 [marine sediment metagenome]|uniref:Uncharacterized protein n=1 Tax=marine sediment metagenome TaxID=412755 RepID=A0A0F9CW86_9ZZZZ
MGVLMDHPFLRLWDRIAALDVTPQEKTLLWAIARYSHWDDGCAIHPLNKTIKAGEPVQFLLFNDLLF